MGGLPAIPQKSERLPHHLLHRNHLEAGGLSRGEGVAFQEESLPAGCTGEAGCHRHEFRSGTERPGPAWRSRSEDSDDGNSQGAGNMHRSAVIADEEIAGAEVNGESLHPGRFRQGKRGCWQAAADRIDQ